MTGISDSAKLQIYLVINVATELKTFMVKADQKLLTLRNNVEYSTLSSVDITNKIKNSIKQSLTIDRLLFECSNNTI
jgi:hypothetical protein